MRLVYIDIDTLRPDHLGCYGYHRATSPNVDRLAQGALRFEKLHGSDTPCLPSRTALLTGRFGIHNGVVNHGGTDADPAIEGPARQFWSRLQIDSFPTRLKRRAEDRQHQLVRATPLGVPLVCRLPPGPASAACGSATGCCLRLTPAKQP